MTDHTMMASALRVLQLALLLVSASSLRCNTYIGTDTTTGGPGTESCPPRPYPEPRCLQMEYYLLNIRTYGMSCDDLLQCTRLPANATCCTGVGVAGHPLIIRCSDTNFNVTKINASSFLDDPACRTRCRASYNGSK